MDDVKRAIPDAELVEPPKSPDDDLPLSPEVLVEAEHEFFARATLRVKDLQAGLPSDGPAHKQFD